MAATIDKVYEMTGKRFYPGNPFPGRRSRLDWLRSIQTHIAAIIAIEPGGAPGSRLQKITMAVVETKYSQSAIYFGDYIDNGDPAIQATASMAGNAPDLL